MLSSLHQICGYTPFHNQPQHPGLFFFFPFFFVDEAGKWYQRFCFGSRSVGVDILHIYIYIYTRFLYFSLIVLFYVICFMYSFLIYFICTVLDLLPLLYCTCTCACEKKNLEPLKPSWCLALCEVICLQTGFRVRRPSFGGSRWRLISCQNSSEGSSN